MMTNRVQRSRHPLRRYSLLRLFAAMTMAVIAFGLCRYCYLYPSIAPCVFIPYATGCVLAIAFDFDRFSRHRKALPVTSAVTIAISLWTIAVVLVVRYAPPDGQDSGDLQMIIAFTVVFMSLSTLTSLVMLAFCYYFRRPVRRKWSRLAGVLYCLAWMGIGWHFGLAEIVGL